MSRWSDLLRSASDTLASLQNRMKCRKLWMMNSNMRLWWHATAITRLTRSALFAGICVLKLVDLNKVKQVPPFPWSSTSANSTTNKSWVSISLFLKLSKNAKIFTYLQSSACWSASLRRCVRTRKLWLLCVKVSSRSHMTVSDQFAS